MISIVIDEKNACLISSSLSIVAWIALWFTPFAGIGVVLIGQGIGGIVGSIAGGITYRGIMSYKLSQFYMEIKFTNLLLEQIVLICYLKMALH